MHYTIRERFLRVVAGFLLSIIFLLILLLVPLSSSSYSGSVESGQEDSHSVVRVPQTVPAD